MNSRPEGFIRSSHYHCKKCGGELEFLGRMGWTANGGIKSIGSCDQCNLLMVERENPSFHGDRVKWVEV